VRPGLSRAPQAAARLRLHDLAGRAVLSRSGLTRLVDRLQDEGLLRRERCAEDRRGYHAVITDKGRKAVREAWPVYRRGIEQYFARHLGALQLRTITETLDQIPKEFPA
jgi:DNA-binding MarR family transcriptional regulator